MCVDDTDNRGIRVVLSSRFQDMKGEDIIGGHKIGFMLGDNARTDWQR